MFPCELPPLFRKVILLMWKGRGETCPFLNVLHVIFLFCPIFFWSTLFFSNWTLATFFPPLLKIMFPVHSSLGHRNAWAYTQQGCFLCFLSALSLLLSSVLLGLTSLQLWHEAVAEITHGSMWKQSVQQSRLHNSLHSAHVTAASSGQFCCRDAGMWMFFPKPYPWWLGRLISHV